VMISDLMERSDRMALGIGRNGGGGGTGDDLPLPLPHLAKTIPSHSIAEQLEAIAHGGGLGLPEKRTTKSRSVPIAMRKFGQRGKQGGAERMGMEVQV
ncbi:hypothetical protein HDU93_007320, partial [Gonapodya sp. JEL0774]